MKTTGSVKVIPYYFMTAKDMQLLKEICISFAVITKLSSGGVRNGTEEIPSGHELRKKRQVCLLQQQR